MKMFIFLFFITSTIAWANSAPEQIYMSTIGGVQVNLEDDIVIPPGKNVRVLISKSEGDDDSRHSGYFKQECFAIPKDSSKNSRMIPKNTVLVINQVYDHMVKREQGERLSFSGIAPHLDKLTFKLKVSFVNNSDKKRNLIFDCSYYLWFYDSAGLQKRFPILKDISLAQFLENSNGVLTLKDLTGSTIEF